MTTPMRYTMRVLGIASMVYGFLLAFIIQSANTEFAISSGVMGASAASLDAYLSSGFLALFGFNLATWVSLRK